MKYIYLVVVFGNITVQMIAYDQRHAIFEFKWKTKDISWEDVHLNTTHILIDAAISKKFLSTVSCMGYFIFWVIQTRKNSVTAKEIDSRDKQNICGRNKISTAQTITVFDSIQYTINNITIPEKFLHYASKN